jgi:hypothetical protein
MKNYAEILNNVVINLIVADPTDLPDWIAPPEYIQSDTAQIGDTYVDGQFIPYVAPDPTAEENKQRAVILLQETDWTSVPDVGNSAMSNPYLINQAEFIAWRSGVRTIAVKPVAGRGIFTAKPQEQWSS